jgi:glycerol-3-phosphate O-acyltransferase
MSKALTVLAECVDARSGKRFNRGDVFDPAPNPEQARRLIAANCLPKEALDAAVAAETEAEKATEEAAKKKAAEEKAAAKAEADKIAAEDAAKKDGK